jgi:hypothetical protein
MGGVLGSIPSTKKRSKAQILGAGRTLQKVYWICLPQIQNLGVRRGAAQVVESTWQAGGSAFKLPPKN